VIHPLRIPAGHDTERSMNTDLPLVFAGVALAALPSGALWWPDRRMLVAGDLHLGLSDRAARTGGALLPPYEVDATLDQLEAAVAALDPATVLCLGDSFDDRAAADRLAPAHRLRLTRLMAGRRWLWVEGNHDPGPLDLGGTHLAEHAEGGLTFRHIAMPGGRAEVSAHYHPKARVGGAARPCFLVDAQRLILPAFGAYTGGLRWDAPVLRALMGPGARALLTGPRVVAVPMPAPLQAKAAPGQGQPA
jgi:uncharacterized protein